MLYFPEKLFVLLFHCAGGVVGDLVMGKSFGVSYLAATAIDFEAQMMASEGEIKFADGTAYAYKQIQDFSQVRCEINKDTTSYVI